jgi:hypothetical protein
MSSQPSQQNTNQTKTNTPLTGGQGDLFSNVWGNTSNTLSKDLSTPIPQNYVAGATPQQEAGVNWMSQIAPSLGGGAAGTQDQVNKIASGWYTNPWNNPNFEGAVSAALAPGVQNLTQNILPQVQDVSLKASGAGTGPAAYGGTGGGSPQDILTENVLQNWGNTAANTGASMANNAFNAGLSLIPQIPGLAQSATTQALTPASTLEAAGGLQQSFNQGGLQNIIDAYMANTQNPFQFESQAANIGAQGGFGNQSGTGVTTGTPPNLMTQWLQGLTGGAGALGSLFGAPKGGTSAMGTIGSGISSGWDWLTGLLGTAAPVAAAAL